MPATPVGELHAELSSQYSFVRFAKLLAAIFFLLNLTFFGFTPIGTTFVSIVFFIVASDFMRRFCSSPTCPTALPLLHPRGMVPS